MSRKCDYDESVNYEKNTKKMLAKTFATKSVEIRLKDRTYHRRRIALEELPQYPLSSGDRLSILILQHRIAVMRIKNDK